MYNLETLVSVTDHTKNKNDNTIVLAWFEEWD